MLRFFLPSYFLFLLVVNAVNSQRSSPCPEIFHYESRSPGDEENRWYGVASLHAKEDSSGVWVLIRLDRRAERLGSFLGAPTTPDNKEFTILNSNQQLKAGSSLQMRFYVDYDANQPVPGVIGIHLNGKVLCNVTDTHSTNRGANTRPSGGNSRPNTQQNTNNNNKRPSQGTQTQVSNVNRPLNVDTDSYSTDQSDFNPAFGSANRPAATSRPNVRPQQTQNSRPQQTNTGSNSNNRPSTNGNTNTRVTYQNNDEYGSNNNRPYNGNDDGVSSSKVNRPLNVNVDGYGTSQNEFTPAFGSTDNQQNNRLPVDSYDTSRPINSNNVGSSNNNNLGTSTIHQRPSLSSSGDSDFFPGDYSISRPIPKPASSRPSVLLNQKPACGTVFTRPTPLITHGLETEEGQYPWHVALYHSQGIQLTYICGGSLISEDYVVTAAHCVTNPSTGQPNNPQNILVYLGKTNLKKFGADIQDRDVSKILVHRDYNHTVFHNDIALLKLGHPADITNYVRPVCLWESSTDLNSVLDQLGTVVGWGFDENGQLTTSLMQTKMPVVSSIKCVYSNPDFFSRFTFDKSFCAGFRNGTTVCNGDSGGGMVFPKTKRNGEILSWHLRGLVSVGVALQGKTSCDPSHYIVFTDVAKHLDWIHNTINNYY